MPARSTGRRTRAPGARSARTGGTTTSSSRVGFDATVTFIDNVTLLVACDGARHGSTIYDVLVRLQRQAWALPLVHRLPPGQLRRHRLRGDEACRESRQTRRRWAIVVSLLVVAAALLASSVIAGQFRSPDPASLRRCDGNRRGDPCRGHRGGGRLPARGAFAQVTRDTGSLCVCSTHRRRRRRERGGGCNSADDPLGGSAISASLAYDGGPAIEGVRDARLIGLAAADVARSAC